jgi:ubiquinone/menaquinone biosynthesis C-methylase UbiE
MKKALEPEKKKANLIQRCLIVFMSFFLTPCLYHIVFAEEKTPRGADSSKKMDVSKYDENARGINAPIYTYCAEKIKEKAGTTKGVCLDVGSGGGYMGLALAKITDLDFIFLDISPEMLEKAKLHIVEDGLQKRAKTLLADVHSIPLPDGSINLVISRGSLPFWKEPVKALKELYRVLAPGGKAYVVLGGGSPEIWAQIEAKRKELGMESQSRPKSDKGPRKFPQRNYDKILKDTGITKYSIIKGNDGMWIQMWK